MDAGAAVIGRSVIGQRLPAPEMLLIFVTPRKFAYASIGIIPYNDASTEATAV